MRSLYKIVIFSLLFLNSCSKIIPAKFWENYQKNKIVTKYSDHGPWGGKTKILWKSNQNIFRNSDIFLFAEKNNWKIADSLNIENGNLKSSNSNYYMEIIKNEKLINSDFENGKIYVFTTGMISIEPGNTSETQKNGFVILNNEKNKMLVFNNWGE